MLLILISPVKCLGYFVDLVNTHGRGAGRGGRVAILQLFHRVLEVSALPINEAGAIVVQAHQAPTKEQSCRSESVVVHVSLMAAQLA